MTMQANMSVAAQVARAGGAGLAALTHATGDWRALLRDWSFWADKRQLPPDGDWRTWVIMAGRGFGKTRAGAEWVRSVAENARAGETVRIALVGATMEEARAVMVEGPSGLLAIAPTATRPVWEPSRGRLRWKSGAEAWLYSGESPEKLRGPEHSHGWCDELAKWSQAQAVWDNLAMTMRAGRDPRVLVTTTPRAVPILRRILAAADTVVTKGRTRDNLMLPDAFRHAMMAHYGGTRLGRQELEGELIEDVAGSLWPRALIEASRVGADQLPLLRRLVIAVDPPAGAGNGDACGIVVAGLGRDGVAYVIEDASVEGRGPEGWARAVAATAMRHQADRVVAEANNGGAMVESVLRAAAFDLPLRLVHASKGKSARAEPVAALFEAGRAKLVGGFAALEDELSGLILGGGYEGPRRSPDRADAMVWALTELMLGRGRGEVRVRGL
ncbi:DNA-packaging protein [Aquisediminimonas sediminicola]|uniref:DNA-packaging protein n=1 Tax=Alteraquisediminimonas sediminicola TaxID=2676787 RepID=UPI001FE49C4A|nr:terminase family protein [Aquisediminimonas sediminicola]